MADDAYETLRKIALLSQQGAKVTINVKHMNIRQTHVRQVHIASPPARSATTHVLHSSTYRRSELDCRWESADQQARMQYRSTKQFAHVRSETRLSQDVCRPTAVSDNPPRRQYNHGSIGGAKQKQRSDWKDSLIGVVVFVGIVYLLAHLAASTLGMMHFPLQRF